MSVAGMQFNKWLNTIYHMAWCSLKGRSSKDRFFPFALFSYAKLLRSQTYVNFHELNYHDAPPQPLLMVMNWEEEAIFIQSTRKLRI